MNTEANRNGFVEYLRELRPIVRGFDFLENLLSEKPSSYLINMPDSLDINYKEMVLPAGIDSMEQQLSEASRVIRFLKGDIERPDNINAHIKTSDWVRRNLTLTNKCFEALVANSQSLNGQAVDLFKMKRVIEELLSGCLGATNFPILYHGENRAVELSHYLLLRMDEDTKSPRKVTTRTFSIDARR